MVNQSELWLDNLSEGAMKQALRFVLNLDLNDEEVLKNIEYLRNQIIEFAKMYGEA